jgi:hypothetical protein
MNDPDISWLGVAITQSGMIAIARRIATQFECGTCGRTPCSSPSFCKICGRADRRAFKDRPKSASNSLRGAAPSVVEALAYSLRQGPKACDRPDNTRRLGELSEDQLRDVVDRVQRFRADLEYEGNKAVRWTAEQSRALIDKWIEIQHG